MRPRCVVGVLAVAVLTVAGCTAGRTGSASGEGSPEQSAVAPVPSVGASVTVAGLTASYHGSQDIKGATTQLTIEMKDFFFEPTVLHGAPGQRVAFTLRNSASAQRWSAS